MISGILKIHCWKGSTLKAIKLQKFKRALLKNCVVREIYVWPYLLHSLLNKIRVPLSGMNFYQTEVLLGLVPCFVTGSAN